MASYFEKLKAGLSKTRQSFVANVVHIVTGRANLDELVVEELENTLIGADLGYGMATEIVERLRERIGVGQAISRQAVVTCLKEFLLERLNGSAQQAVFPKNFFEPAANPYVLMVAGVNGVGKTTTIAKLAHRFRESGRSVLIAAADTFRAAAAEQVEIWADRVGVEVVRTQAGGDPASVVFDAVQSAVSRNVDCVIIDTAGRLHTKHNLMEELKKMKRVMQRVLPEAPHDVFLVLDANTGQNGLRQAEAFLQAVNVTGLIITKLDGTAKGGIVFTIYEKLKIPVRFVGVGEGMDDLQPFDAERFVEALFES